MNIVPLDVKRHKREAFDCGVEVLNSYLCRYAGQQAAKNHARTYVAEADMDGTIAGFYTLTMIQLELCDIPLAMQKKHGTAQAAGLIARLAVDRRFQSRGIGGHLLYDALTRLYQAAFAVGFPLIFVDPKDGVEDFYARYGFVKVTHNRMYLPVATISQLVSA